MADLSLNNVINISVQSAGTGLGEYNTSNLACFTRETPAGSFGSLGYARYKDPTDVATDFGSDSVTYAMALSVFSQQPNLLAGNGDFIVIPLLNTAQTAVQRVSFPEIPASGTFMLNYGANATPPIAYNASQATIQTALRTINGLSGVTVTGSVGAQSFDITFEGVSGAVANLTVSSNSLEDSDEDAVSPTVWTVTIGSANETYDAAITRAASLVQFFGCIITEICNLAVQNAAAAVVQALQKMAFFVSNNQADVAPGGMLDQLRSASFSYSRGLFYGGSTAAALSFMGAYAGRALSTIFSGSNTTGTMHLKDLSGVQPDPVMTQTLLGQCQAAGADVYVSIQGVPKTFCSGANRQFDSVYNQLWFVGALKVAYFNALATVSTKIAQTEAGIMLLKGALRVVCEQAVTNQYLSAGTWTLPQTFGNQDDFYKNIGQRGYYMYSAPVGSQTVAQRNSRGAPVIQIAGKEAGAVHSGTVIVNINQ